MFHGAMGVKVARGSVAALGRRPTGQVTHPPERPAPPLPICGDGVAGNGRPDEGTGTGQAASAEVPGTLA
jgi:hypothetical protein